MRDPVRLTLSDALREVIEEAEDIAAEAGQVPGSVHLLLAFFTTRNRTERFLRERHLDEDRLLKHVPPGAREPKGSVRTIMEKAAQLAAGCGSERVEGLHVLVGMTRVRESGAYRVLDGAGVCPARLRTRALTLLTSATPRWLHRDPSGVAPSGQARHHLSRRPRPPQRLESPGPFPWEPPLVPPPVKQTRRDPPPRPKADPTPSSSAYPERRDVEASPGLDAVTGRVSEVTLEAREGPAERPTSSAPESARPSEERPTSSAPESARPSEASSSSGPSSSAWMLPEEEFPWLSSLGRNLSLEAARGELDVLVGREHEVEQLIDVLGKRRSNNPCLVGEPGVGKTAIVEGLAARWVRSPPSARERIIVGLDAGRLLVGTHLRGSFSEKLNGLKDEVKRAQGRVLVFFDELHTLVGAGASGDGPLDAANELKAALGRGEFPCIGATTTDEYRRHITKDPALERRFVPILVKEPSAEEAEAMLRSILPAYADHHAVVFTDQAVQAAVRLSVRFLTEQHLPDKAIALLDLAGSRAARSGQTEVGHENIAHLVAERVRVPVERMLDGDRSRLLTLESELSRRIVGHERALGRIAEVIRRHAAGFGTHRPLGIFLLVGPSGVGKTETAKALAHALHGDEQSLVRFDLSEFSEPHSVARLIGAPPGYVGHDAGGQLTEAVRKRPACILLFDEVEKAHREVLQVLLQILDDGRLSDGHGRTHGFSEAIVVLTSNLGSERIYHRHRRIGFEDTSDAEDLESAVMTAARRGLAPELWSRIDEKFFYPPLKKPEVRRIARLLVADSSARLERERGIAFELDGLAVDAVLEQGGFEASLGARPLRRVLGHLVESPIAARILEGRLHAGERVLVSRHTRGGLVFRVGGERATLSQRPKRSVVPRRAPRDPGGR